MSDMVERVAQAIYAERYLVEIYLGAMPAWEDAQGSDRTNTFDEARAAIEAMREPTGVMRVAGAHICDQRPSEVAAIFTAMIDEALK